MTAVETAQEEYEAAWIQGLGGTQNYPSILARAMVLNAALNVENERLKCCGNCERWNPWDTPTSCAVDSMYAIGSKPCHFIPPLWADRGTP